MLGIVFILFCEMLECLWSSGRKGPWAALCVSGPGLIHQRAGPGVASRLWELQAAQLSVQQGQVQGLQTGFRAAVRGAERVVKLAAAGGGGCFFGGHPMLLAVGWPLWLSNRWCWWAPSERPLFLINSCFPTGAWNEDLLYGYQDILNGNNVFVTQAKLIEIVQV